MAYVDVCRIEMNENSLKTYQSEEERAAEDGEEGG